MLLSITRNNSSINLLREILVKTSLCTYFTRNITSSNSRLLRGYYRIDRSNYINKNKNLVFYETTLRFTTSTTNNASSTEQELTAVQFEKISNETLDSLTEYFDEIVEDAAHLKDADVSYGDGVLTVKFGNSYGTYVINRQTPNKQLWLSSPTSGPKRYDFIDGKWIYKHDGVTLHELLNAEIPAIVKNKICFDQCSYSGKSKE